MKPLFDINILNNSKGNDLFPFECEQCEKTFLRKKYDIVRILNYKDYHLTKIKYCSNECKYIARNKKIKVVCLNCDREFNKFPNEIKNSQNHFCSRSCAATYNNKHKTTGNRRSKLETYLENELTKLYPDLDIHFNRKDSINSELDIYVPSLKLAFELNGIFHYEPIFGEDKLNKIVNNDNRKFQACLEQGIELCIIDSSQQKYFKEQTSQKYLNIICDIINEKYP